MRILFFLLFSACTVDADLNVAIPQRYTCTSHVVCLYTEPQTWATFDGPTETHCDSASAVNASYTCRLDAWITQLAQPHPNVCGYSYDCVADVEWMPWDECAAVPQT